MGSIPRPDVSFRASARSDLHGLLGDHQQVAVSLLSRAQLCPCMRAKGHCWIRVQQQVFHVASCWSGGHGVCGGCRCAQMSLKSPGGRCNQSQLSSWAPPRFEYSLLLFSLPHQQCQGSMLSISSSFFLMKPSMELYRWQSLVRLQGKGFLLISCVALRGHGIKDDQSLPSHIVKSVKEPHTSKWPVFSTAP